MNTHMYSLWQCASSCQDVDIENAFGGSGRKVQDGR